MHILLILLVAFFSFFTFILSMPYQVYLVLTLFSFFVLNRPILAIIFLILALLKIDSKRKIRMNFKFHNYTNFNENNYTNFNESFFDDKNDNENNYNTSEYENACMNLGVDSSMPYEEKKKVYKKLQLKYHPDVNGSSEAEKMSKLINSSWDIIEKYEKK